VCQDVPIRSDSSRDDDNGRRVRITVDHDGVLFLVSTELRYICISFREVDRSRRVRDARH